MELLKKSVKHISGIYKITNRINNKFYIGSSVNILNRYYRHISMLRKGCHNNLKLQNSYNKNKEYNFTFEVISTCPKEYCIKLEQWFIDNLKPEYNIAPTAASTLGCRYKRKSNLSDEIINNILNDYVHYTNNDLANKYNLSIHIIDSILYSKQSFKDFNKDVVKNSKLTKDTTRNRMKNLHYHRKINKIKNGSIKLTMDNVYEIKKLYSLDYPTKEIANKFNVSKETVNSIINKRTWKDVPDYVIKSTDVKYNVKRKTFLKYDKNLVENILQEYFQNNLSGKEIKEKFNLSSNVYKILKGEFYKDLYKKYNNGL